MIADTFSFLFLRIILQKNRARSTKISLIYSDQLRFQRLCLAEKTFFFLYSTLAWHAGMDIMLCAVGARSPGYSPGYLPFAADLVVYIQNGGETVISIWLPSGKDVT